MLKKYSVEPDTVVDLSSWDPDDTGGKKKGDRVDEQLARDIERLSELQERLYAESGRAVLVVLQAMDTGGKDGTLKHVFSGLNPSSCRVTSFKVPTPEEAGHDFLWRIHRACPRFGEIGIFNRSHYEDVLVVRVHELVPASVWSERYEQINRFERHLSDTGTRVVKFFLHISRGEQKKRLEARLADPSKHWKWSDGDVKERLLWDDYQTAYADALSKCSTVRAPWIIVPADHKWYRNLVVARCLVEILEEMDPQPPRSKVDPSSIRID